MSATREAIQMLKNQQRSLQFETTKIGEAIDVLQSTRATKSSTHHKTAEWRKKLSQSMRASWQRRKIHSTPILKPLKVTNGFLRKKSKAA